MRTVRVPVLLAPIGLIVAIVTFAVLALLVPVLVALPIAIVLGVAAALHFYFRSESAVVGGIPLRTVDESDEPRIHNMIDGLCDSHGFHRPTLAIIDDDSRNAVVFGRSPERITLAVTRGLRDSVTRMELEGVLARELALATHPGLPAATVLVPILAMLPASLRSPIGSWFVGDQRTFLDDFDAVRFTRYPPGLAAALDKLAEGSTVVPGAGRTSGYLWVVPPSAAGSPAPDTPTIDARAAALREL